MADSTNRGVDEKHGGRQRPRRGGQVVVRSKVKPPIAPGPPPQPPPPPPPNDPPSQDR
jgi:hypothetical protein